MAFVYILECEDGSLYTGSTTNLTRRIKQHFGLIKNGRAKYTRSHKPIKLMMVWQTENFSKACRLEYAIKKVPRSVKLSLIENPSCEHIFQLFPNLCDFSFTPLYDISLEQFLSQ